MPLDQAQAGQLVDAQALIQARLAEQALAQARFAIAGFTQWYDNAAVTKLAQQIAAAVQSAQKIAASTTDAYLVRAAGQMTGRIHKAAGPIDISRLRAGTTAERVYERLGKNYRYLIAEKRPVEVALTATHERAAAMIQTDVQLAQRAQTVVTLAAQHIETYRRIIHPERSKGGTCGLCAAASDRIYHVKVLAPIHTGCKCTFLPASQANDDPGYRLNKDDLALIYGEAGGAGKDALKRVQYKVHHHGELGPILTNSKYDWRSPDDVRAAA